MPGRAQPAPGRLSRAVAAILRDERDAQGLTQGKLGVMARISQPHLSELERGVKSMTVDQMDRLCTALGLSFEDVARQAAKP